MSSLKCGLMPLTQESCLVGKVSYHDSFGPEVDKAAVARDLGVHNKVNEIYIDFAQSIYINFTSNKIL